MIVSQPNANAADYSSSRAVPNLRRAMTSTNVKTRASVTEVVGEIDPQEIQNFITSKCDALVENFVASGMYF